MAPIKNRPVQFDLGCVKTQPFDKMSASNRRGPADEPFCRRSESLAECVVPRPSMSNRSDCSCATVAHSLATILYEYSRTLAGPHEVDPDVFGLGGDAVVDEVSDRGREVVVECA